MKRNNNDEIEVEKDGDGSVWEEERGGSAQGEKDEIRCREV
jgi:hypothetical protein